MIKVNLLKEPKAEVIPTKERRSLIPEINRMGLLAALLITVCFVSVGWVYWYADHQRAATVQKLTANREELEALKVFSKLQIDLEKQKKDLDYRIEVIEKLKNNQSGPVRLLNVLMASIPDEPTIWFDLLTQRDKAVQLEGYAVTADVIPEFISKLKSSGFFKTVDIDYYTEEAQAVKFALNCVVAEQKTNP